MAKGRFFTGSVEANTPTSIYTTPASTTTAYHMICTKKYNDGNNFNANVWFKNSNITRTDDGVIDFNSLENNTTDFKTTIYNSYASGCSGNDMTETVLVDSQYQPANIEKHFLSRTAGTKDETWETKEVIYFTTDRTQASYDAITWVTAPTDSKFYICGNDNDPVTLPHSSWTSSIVVNAYDATNDKLYLINQNTLEAIGTTYAVTTVAGTNSAYVFDYSILFLESGGIFHCISFCNNQTRGNTDIGSVFNQTADATLASADTSVTAKPTNGTSYGLHLSSTGFMFLYSNGTSNSIYEAIASPATDTTVSVTTMTPTGTVTGTIYKWFLISDTNSTDQLVTVLVLSDDGGAYEAVINTSTNTVTFTRCADIGELPTSGAKGFSYNSLGLPILSYSSNAYLASNANFNSTTAWASVNYITNPLTTLSNVLTQTEFYNSNIPNLLDITKQNITSHITYENMSTIYYRFTPNLVGETVEDTRIYKLYNINFFPGPRTYSTASRNITYSSYQFPSKICLGTVSTGSVTLNTFIAETETVQFYNDQTPVTDILFSENMIGDYVEYTGRMISNGDQIIINSNEPMTITLMGIEE